MSLAGGRFLSLSLEGFGAGGCLGRDAPFGQAGGWQHLKDGTIAEADEAAAVIVVMHGLTFAQVARKPRERCGVWDGMPGRRKRLSHRAGMGE